jgi:FixJ family two-component response regulator
VDFLRKPFSEEALFAAIQAAINHNQPHFDRPQPEH